MKYLKFLFKTFLGFFTHFRDLTLENIKRYFQGSTRYLFLESLEEHIKDQFFYRVTVTPQDCIEKGCPGCGCTFPERQLTDDPCIKNCYPWFLEKKDWENYCVANQINITFVRKRATEILDNLDKLKK